MRHSRTKPVRHWPVWRRRSPWSLALVAILLVLTPLPPAWSQNQPTLEYQVKASYLYNFLQFVEWPPKALGDETLLVCIFGENNFGTTLQTITGATVRGLTVAVRHFSEPEGLEVCHVVFVSASSRDRESLVLKRLAGRPVLTIGETTGFTERGGAINLIRIADKIHFEINRQVAERNLLKISAQLLQLGNQR